MRTRALFYIVLGALILAALLVLDLVVHSYTAIGGPLFELIRAGIQGAAMMWFARAAEILFFRSSPVSRADELKSAAYWPVRLVQRFTIALGASVLLALTPYLFTLSYRKISIPPFKVEPTSFSTVVSIDILGLFWLLMLVGVLLSFWRIIFIRQSSRFANRRFTAWAISIAALSLFWLWKSEGILPAGEFTSLVHGILILIVGLCAILLGYRLPWLPHATRAAKRRLLLFAALNIVLAMIALVTFGGDHIIADTLFERYALLWHTVAIATFATLAVYFTLVFISTLFSLSSTELVERKAA